ATVRADLQVLMLEVADLTHGRAAAEADAPQLRRRQLQQGVVTLLRHQLDGRARAPAELRAATRPQLDGVHHGPERDVGERQAAPGLDVGLRAGLHHIADTEAHRREDVAARPVGGLDERDARPATAILL